MSAAAVALPTEHVGSPVESPTVRRHCWLLFAISLLALPLKAWALPIGVSDPVELPLGVDTEVVLRVDGISSSRTVVGLDLRIPTNVAGYEVVGGSIHADLPFGDLLYSTAKFRPAEDELFLSLLILNSSLELTEPLDIAVLTLRGLVAGTEVMLKPASTIVRGDLKDWPLGGAVIARVGNQGPSDPGDPYSSDPAKVTITLRDWNRYYPLGGGPTGISNSVNDLIVQTPEPGPFALVALGVAALLIRRVLRRRRLSPN
jgi:hypothetical protein